MFYKRKLKVNLPRQPLKLSAPNMFNEDNVYYRLYSYGCHGKNNR